jgi:hypothetical protein
MIAEVRLMQANRENRFNLEAPARAKRCPSDRTRDPFRMLSWTIQTQSLTFEIISSQTASHRISKAIDARVTDLAMANRGEAYL